jgi:hypothetical protein
LAPTNIGCEAFASIGRWPCRRDCRPYWAGESRKVAGIAQSIPGASAPRLLTFAPSGAEDASGCGRGSREFQGRCRLTATLPRAMAGWAIGPQRSEDSLSVKYPPAGRPVPVPTANWRVTVLECRPTSGYLAVHATEPARNRLPSRSASLPGYTGRMSDPARKRRLTFWIVWAFRLFYVALILILISLLFPAIEIQREGPAARSIAISENRISD